MCILIVLITTFQYLPVGGLATDLRLELTVAPWTHALKAVGAIVQMGVGTATELASTIKAAGLCTPTLNVDSNGLWEDGDDSPASGGSYFTTDPATLIAMSDAVGLNECTVRITNAELVLEYIEVSSDVQMAIEGSTGGNYILSFESWNNFQNTIKSNPGSVAQLIGAKFSSIKTAMTIFRDQFALNRLAFTGVSSRLNPFSVRPNREDDIISSLMPYINSKWQSGTGWYYQVGATHYPPKPIASDEESWMEAVKSQHAVAVMQLPGNINKDTWSVSARRDTDGTITSDGTPQSWWHYPLQGGAFFCAQNFESQSHKSHLTESGINTLAQSMYLVARFPPEAAIDGMYATSTNKTKGIYDPLDTMPNQGAAWRQTNQGLQLDTFIHYDGILLISNGICSTRF